MTGIPAPLLRRPHHQIAGCCAAAETLPDPDHQPCCSTKIARLTLVTAWTHGDITGTDTATIGAGDVVRVDLAGPDRRAWQETAARMRRPIRPAHLIVVSRSGNGLRVTVRAPAPAGGLRDDPIGAAEHKAAEAAQRLAAVIDADTARRRTDHTTPKPSELWPELGVPPPPPPGAATALNLTATRRRPPPIDAANLDEAVADLDTPVAAALAAAFPDADNPNTWIGDAISAVCAVNAARRPPVTRMADIAPTIGLHEYWAPVVEELLDYLGWFQTMVLEGWTLHAEDLADIESVIVDCLARICGYTGTTEAADAAAAAAGAVRAAVAFAAAESGLPPPPCAAAALTEPSPRVNRSAFRLLRRLAVCARRVVRRRRFAPAGASHVARRATRRRSHTQKANTPNTLYKQ